MLSELIAAGLVVWAAWHFNLAQIYRGFFDWLFGV